MTKTDFKSVLTRGPRYRSGWLLSGYLLICLILPAVHAAEPDALRYTVRVEAPYEDVVDNVKFAISNNNFRITGGNNIGGAIAERHNLVFPLSEVVHFCNLEYARTLLELAPDFVTHMPCTISIREDNDAVVIETKLLAQRDDDSEALSTMIDEINDLLMMIVDEAAE